MVTQRSRQNVGWGGRETVGKVGAISAEHWYSVEEDVHCVLNRWLLSSLSRRRLSDANELQTFEDRNSGHLASMM